MLSITASLLLVGCVDYTLNDTDSELDPTVSVSERFVQVPLPAVDILFVVDSTGSMEVEQASLAAEASTFLGALDTRAISYQIGVTSTDPADEGALLGRPWIVTPTTEGGADALAAALSVGTDSAPPSAGLYTASLALAAESRFNRGFRRPDASLHVVFLSDGDDESDDWYTAAPELAFAAALEVEAEETGRSAIASAIVGDVPAGCRGEGGSASPGTRYVALAQATGGVVESICAADFAGLAATIGEASVEWTTVFALQAVPLDGTVLVEIDGVRVATGWSVDSAVPALVFEVAPAPDAQILVTYDTAGEAP